MSVSTIPPVARTIERFNHVIQMAALGEIDGDQILNLITVHHRIVNFMKGLSDQEYQGFMRWLSSNQDPVYQTAYGLGLLASQSKYELT